MSILADESTRVMVSGVTGREGAFHTNRMLAAGTRVVAGVTPGKSGHRVHGVPVFDTAHDAVAATGAEAAVLFVPARFAADAMLEAADAGVRLVVAISEGIPVADMVIAVAQLDRLKVRLVGPNCPGLISAGRASLGIMPAATFRLGKVGVISRSGTLTYQIVASLASLGIGQSSAVGIGGDPIHGMGFVDCLELFEADADTEAMVLVGEIGGNEEELAANYIEEHVSKPVVAYIAGLSAPPGKVMGHAGAIVTGSSGTAAAKVQALEGCGVRIARRPEEVAELLSSLFLPEQRRF